MVLVVLLASFLILALFGRSSAILDPAGAKLQGKNLRAEMRLAIIAGYGALVCCGASHNLTSMFQACLLVASDVEGNAR